MKKAFKVWVSVHCVDAGQFFVSRELPMGHSPKHPGYYMPATLTVDSKRKAKRKRKAKT